MGADSSRLKDYEFVDYCAVESGNHKVCQAKRKDGEVLTAFLWEKCKKEENTLAINAAKHLRILRHPGIVKYYDYLSDENNIFLVTEKVSSIESVIDDMNPLEIISGLFDIITTVVFLHEKCRLSHNNICLESIFVTGNGKWKLSGMHFLCPFDKLDKQFVQQVKSVCHKDSLCPEDMDQKLSVDKYCGHERDAYAMSASSVELLSKCTNEVKGYDALMNKLKLLMSDHPLNRPQLNILLNEEIFANDYLHVRNFLENITLKTNDEKLCFFRSCSSKIFNLPEDLVAGKLSHLLLSRLVLLDKSAYEYLLPDILTPCHHRNGDFKDGQINPIFTASSYKKCIIPRLCMILTVKDISIRLVLLHHFSSYVGLIPKSCLQHDILPKLLIGLKDTNDTLVATTLRALADMIPILGGSVVIGGTRARLFTDAVPKELLSSPSYDCAEEATTPESSSATSTPSKHELREKRREELRKKRMEREQKKETDEKTASKPSSVVSKNKVIPQETVCADISKNDSEKDTPIDKDWSKLDKIPERSSPDGGEDMKSKLESSIQLEAEEWSDWGDLDSEPESGGSSSGDENSEIQDESGVNSTPSLLTLSKQVVAETSDVESIKNKAKRNPLKLSKISEKSDKSDDSTVTADDAKPNKSLHNNELGEEFNVLSTTKMQEDAEVSLFDDMQPVITKSSVLIDTNQSVPSSKFDFTNVNFEQEESGWGDDLEWGNISDDNCDTSDRDSNQKIN